MATTDWVRPPVDDPWLQLYLDGLATAVVDSDEGPVLNGIPLQDVLDLAAGCDPDKVIFDGVEYGFLGEDEVERYIMVDVTYHQSNLTQALIEEALRLRILAEAYGATPEQVGRITGVPE